jgi:DNA processing protein
MGFALRDLLILTTIPGIGPNRLRSLLDHFKDPAIVARAPAKQLAEAEGIERKTALTIVNFFRNGGASTSRRFVDDQLSRLNKVGARVVTLWDREYPSNLKRIYDPPPFLFVQGKITESDHPSIAIVGTRSPTAYGVQLAESFGAGLADLGITIISGLARGIDTCAHAAALRTGGRTIAVIGSGVDVIYPPENKHLAERILASGAIISEFPMGAKPDAGNFPRRNRIISGISIATLVVETGIDGGAMITASMALDQNRQVFALPSPINPKRKSGTNLLIKESRAMLTETTEDILTELAPHLKRLAKFQDRSRSMKPPDLTLFEQRLYEALPDNPIHIDALAAHAGLSTSDALVHLLSMEFKGLVRQLPGKLFVRL